MAIVLVTGAAGFIGFHVAKALSERGDTVIGIDNLSSYYDVNLKKARLRQLRNIGFYKADIANKLILRKIFTKNKFDKICHLAAQAGVRHSIQHPTEYERTNVLGTLNILELMKEFRIKDIVYASSSSVYGGIKKIPFKESIPLEKPISFYAATKKMNELMAHTYHSLHGFNCTGLRYFTVYGPWGRPDMALFKFTKNILNNQPIELYNYGNMKRDFTFVTDIAAGTIAALDKCYPYEIFNLGNSRPIQLRYFVECIENALGRKAQKKFLPIQQGDVPATYADISKARKMLGYKPKVPIEEGILKFINWYKSYYLK